MERKHASWITGVAISAIVAACGSNPTAPTSPVTLVPMPVPAAPTVTTVTVTNTGTTGITFQLGAIAHLSDGGTLDVTKVAGGSDLKLTNANGAFAITGLGIGRHTLISTPL
jgi:hypothetical protein